MTKKSKNCESIQLELPFSKSSYKNNMNNSLISEITIINSVEREDNDLDWFNPHVPHQVWDKRQMKKFIVEIWLTSDTFKFFEIFATSKKVAQNFLEENFCVSGIYSVLDFPTVELNEEISYLYKFKKNFYGEINDNE